MNLCVAQTDAGLIKATEKPASANQYSKDTDYIKERNFDKNLDSKYSGREFTYHQEVIEDEPIVDEEASKSPSFLSGNIRIFIIVLLGVACIFAVLYRSDFSYFKLQKYKKNEQDSLMSEDDESIHENDYDRLIKDAIGKGNFRMATRYYYLSLLKKLTQKELIEYHKDKTNSDYFFELEGQKIQPDFSYLSYIYSYVWYGEFPIDSLKFATIEKKYQSLINQIK
jgi:hypothetical protein